MLKLKLQYFGHIYTLSLHDALPILKLKLQYFVLLMQRADLLEKTLMLAKIDGRRRSGQ